MRKVLIFVLLLATSLVVGCIEMEMAQPEEVGYDIQTRYTKEGEQIHYYNITSEGYYFKPGSRLYLEHPYYDKTVFKSIHGLVPSIEVSGEGIPTSKPRTTYCPWDSDVCQDLFSTEKPIKIDKAIAEAKRLDEQFKKEGFIVNYRTKDGETVKPFFIVNREEYIIPYGAEVGYRDLIYYQGSLGPVMGIDPDFTYSEIVTLGGGDIGDIKDEHLAASERRPTYFTKFDLHDSALIGTFPSAYIFESSEKPIKGKLSDVIQNPEKYGYPKESIKKVPYSEMHVRVAYGCLTLEY